MCGICGLMLPDSVPQWAEHEGYYLDGNLGMAMREFMIMDAVAGSISGKTIRIAITSFRS